MPVKAAAAAAHAQRIYFITGSRPAAPARPGNHLVCFHIHSYEAVICPADCEAGGCLLVLSPRGPAGLCGPLNLQNPTAPSRTPQHQRRDEPDWPDVFMWK